VPLVAVAVRVPVPLVPVPVVLLVAVAVRVPVPVVMPLVPVAVRVPVPLVPVPVPVVVPLVPVIVPVLVAEIGVEVAVLVTAPPLSGADTAASTWLVVAVAVPVCVLPPALLPLPPPHALANTKKTPSVSADFALRIYPLLARSVARTASLIIHPECASFQAPTP